MIATIKILSIVFLLSAFIIIILPIFYPRMLDNQMVRLVLRNIGDVD